MSALRHPRLCTLPFARSIVHFPLCTFHLSPPLLPHGKAAPELETWLAPRGGLQIPAGLQRESLRPSAHAPQGSSTGLRYPYLLGFLILEIGGLARISHGDIVRHAERASDQRSRAERARHEASTPPRRPVAGLVARARFFRLSFLDISLATRNPGQSSGTGEGRRSWQPAPAVRVDGRVGAQFVPSRAAAAGFSPGTKPWHVKVSAGRRGFPGAGL